MISLDKINEFLEYNDGRLYWIKLNSPIVKVGHAVGGLNSEGYRRFQFFGNTLLEHRVVFLMFNKYLPKTIDHIDGVRDNNKIQNLRECTINENCYNSKLNARNSSGVKGVYLHKASNKWMVRASVKGKRMYFGSYDDLELAELVAIEARNKYHGDFAKHV